MEVIFSMAAQDVKLHWNEVFLVFFLHILQGMKLFNFDEQFGQFVPD